ncbi:hypothetical protein DJ90_6463 [Paenibacillus macerans]|uniref:Uncharacterized protein n=1 Tax=Paenibacillus macerans TaxID=44252 RepID=A0A090Y7H5_PAEMA|nr:hypothetical protein DJ90_6463 [Paenibacillus macerans]
MFRVAHLVPMPTCSNVHTVPVHNTLFRYPHCSGLYTPCQNSAVTIHYLLISKLRDAKVQFIHSKRTRLHDSNAKVQAISVILIKFVSRPHFQMHFCTS